MKATFALFVLAALTPCLVTIERLAAATPEAECEACCEKSCCAEKDSKGQTACCREAGDCAQCTATAQSSQTDAKSTACTTKTECSECELKTAAASAGSSLKLFWTLPLTPARETGLSSVTSSKPCSTSPCPSSPCADSACANSAIAAAAEPAATAPCGELAHEISKMRYAAIPVAVPSPFAKGSEYLSAPVLATQAYAATLPLQAPPAPVSQASANVDAPNPVSCPTCVAGAVAPHPVPCPTCIAPAASPRQPEVTQVLFSVDVIEDSSNSLAEYESLQNEMPFLTAESEIVLATLRILERQNLLRRLSNPRLVTTIGRTAVLQVGTEAPIEDGGVPTFNGLRMEVAARELGGGLEIEFKFCDTTGRQCYEVATSLLLAHGQTVVMKACHPKQAATGNAEEGGRKHPVYIVLTPQIVK